MGGDGRLLRPHPGPLDRPLALVASLVFVFLRLMIVQPLGGSPPAHGGLPPAARGRTLDRREPARADEIGVVERELARMRRAAPAPCWRRPGWRARGRGRPDEPRPARTCCPPRVLVSDRLEASPDPEVRSAGVPPDRDARPRDTTSARRRSTMPAAARPPPPRAGWPCSSWSSRCGTPWPTGRSRCAGGSPSTRGLELYADPDQLSRVLLNLARNAYEAMAGRAASCGSRPSRRRRPRGHVADTGPGIPSSACGRASSSRSPARPSRAAAASASPSAAS